MSNFAINFSHPWLLFLFIPAVVILVVAMLRVPRKYRNTRNRVVSVVLESIVLFCVILILSGMTFSYTLGNSQNEIILLVDVTDTMDVCADERDSYVQSVLYEAEANDCKMGVVTFGFTQVYVAPLSTDAEKVYSQYKNATEFPDTTATDLSSALEYTAKLFSNPETSRIVVISDGKETDQSALNTLTAVTSQGTIVETVYVPSTYEGNDIQIVGVETPDYHVSSGDTIEITLDIRSNYSGDVTIVVTDNGEEQALTDDDDVLGGDDGSRTIRSGNNTVTFRYPIYGKTLHAIRITFTDIDDDILTQNNTYCVYIYIDTYNKILIFESVQHESDELVLALQSKEADIDDVVDGEGAYDITVITISDVYSYEFPTTVSELRQYDLVILDNTSNSDMYDGYRGYLEDVVGRMDEFYSYFFTTSGNKKSGGGLLPDLLYDYVYTYGGGLLTVGGVTTDDDGEVVANMYRRSDMYGTVLQQMLPVTAINYTPPTGVVVVIDTSGSMGSGEGSILQDAILGVTQSLDLMSERDYMGIIEFSGSPHIVLDLVSLAYKSEIKNALNNLMENPQSGGTVLCDSLDNAISMLGDDSRFERKHIIVVTDGDLFDTSECVEKAKECTAKGITLSAVVVGSDSGGVNNMSKICEAADGDGYENYVYNCTDGRGNVAESIYEDIEAVVWEEINYEEFQILVSSSYIFSPLVSGLFATDSEGNVDRGHLDAEMTRFYGTTIKSGASLILTGDYSVPIYAQWSFGNGMVGSYMGDLHHYGDSGEKIILDSDSGAGVQFIINAVDNLMPSEDIRPNGIDVSLTEDNYTNRLVVYTNVGEGYTVDAKIYSCDGEDAGEVVLDLNKVTDDITDDLEFYVTTAMDASNNYSRANFVIKRSGVYAIVVTLLDEKGNPVYFDAKGNATQSEYGTQATATIYKKFSYSAEYDNFNADDGEDLLNALSTGTYGGAIEDADDIVYIFDDLETRLSESVDPTLVLIIIALVLFLLGIAVRKFKWKWPHEIVRDRKEREKNQKKT